MSYIPQQILTETAFGEVAAESKTPQVQVKFPYLLHPDIVQSLTNNASSTVTSTGGQATVTCAGAANAFSQIRSKRTLRYGPGQGALMLGTCIFTTGVANSSQVFGAGDDDEGYFWGYNGTSFGVLRRSGGSLEVKSIEITAGATNTGNITITLDGSAVVVAVTAGDTIAEVVEKIVAKHDEFGDAGRGWEVHTDDNVSIEFISFVAEAAAGSFSFADTDTTLVTANAFATEVTGVAPTDTWIALDSGNAQVVDPLDGTGPSGMTIDPTKGNVYCIRFQYLGYGAVDYGVEDPVTGKFVSAVRLRYSNANTSPTLVNPTLHITLIAKTESGYSGGALAMKTASLASFVEGKDSQSYVRRGISGTKSISTTENVVLILHSELDFNNKVNKIASYITLVTASTESSKTTIIRIRREPTSITGAVALTNIEDGVSVMQYSTTGTTITGGKDIQEFTLTSGSPAFLNFDNEELIMLPGERLIFTAEHTGGAAADVTVSASWEERV